MGVFVFNVARGRVAELANRVNQNDPTNAAFVLVCLKAAGLEADSVMKQHTNLDNLLAAANDEATNTGYARKVLNQASGITVTVDQDNNRVDVDFPNQTWTAVQAAGGAWGAILVCYDPDTTSGTDSTIIPLTKQDFVITPDGRDIDAQVVDTGFYRDS